MEDHKDFIEEYNAAIKPICEKHNKELVPVFRFGEQWLPAQLIVNTRDEESKTKGQSDSGDKKTKGQGGKSESDSKDSA